MQYSVRKSLKAKRISITVNSKNEVQVVIPSRVPINIGEAFLFEKREWVKKVIQRNSTLKVLPEKTYKDFVIKNPLVRELVKKKISHFNKHYNFEYKTIKIKSLSSRWGSCSRNKNLNFNYQLIYLNDEQINYIVVHELCHIKELNHSQRFWALVQQTIPNYKQIRQSLKKVH